jgi:hypothetical protein
MAKRFTATEIWDEDWFLDMPNEYKLFWYYMLSSCDHCGLFKVNLRSFCSQLGVTLTPNKALELFNTGKERIREISKSLWLIEDFFVFQYGEKFNRKNRVHESIEKSYLKHGIKLTSIRGLVEVNDRVKDKDKDKDKEIQIGGVEERFLGSVCYDAEKEVLSNQIEFDRICNNLHKNPDQAKESLRKYHLYLTEKEQYPKGRKAVFAGFEKWLMTDKNLSNGKHGTHSVGKTFFSDTL